MTDEDSDRARSPERIDWEARRPDLPGGRPIWAERDRLAWADYLEQANRRRDRLSSAALLILCLAALALLLAVCSIF